jgi:hypothetical protein
MKKILVSILIIISASSVLANEADYLYADYNWDNSPHNYNNSLNNPKAQIFYSTKDKPKGYIVKKGNKLILFDLKGKCKGYIQERGKL